MNQESTPNRGKKSSPPNPAIPTPVDPVKLPPFFRPVDWLAFGITSVLVMIGYMLTLAPDQTLEDSGELAVASMYAGVPHPPGYPVWTIYTWIFTKLLPFYNIAWRVGVSSAFAGAMCCGLIALVTSRGSSMMIESIAALKNIERRSENAICLVSGFAAGMLMGFNGYMWSQSVIVEVYTLSAWSLMLVVASLMRWLYEPDKRRYVYWAFFFFGICLTNHMSLLVAAMGIEIAIMAAQPKFGRDFFAGNSLCFIGMLMMKSSGKLTTFDNNPELAFIFYAIGLLSIGATGWLTFKTGKIGTEWKGVLISGLSFGVGAAFYLYMPVSSMSNPPLNWGYPRTPEGFVHAIKRGQYESVHPVGIAKLISSSISPWKSESRASLERFGKQIWLYVNGAIEEFSIVFLLIALTPFVFYRFMQNREKAWIIGLAAIWLFLAFLLLLLLNPGLDRQSVELHRVFFTASHVIVAIAAGYGMTLIAAYLIVQYEASRIWALLGGAVAIALGLYTLNDIIAVTFEHTGYEGVKLFFHGLATVLKEGDVTLKIYGGMWLLIVTIVFVLLLLMFRARFHLNLLLGLFAVAPVYSILSHWADNEQRNHYYGHWFGHDMFKLDAADLRGKDGKPIYPNMAEDAVEFGGTDPGRFNPTYAIFCDSFTDPEDRTDPEFDRRDVALITQNALADGTYLNYIRAHYNRSAQIDPPFFQTFFRMKPLAFLDKIFLSLGDNIEKSRRVGPSFFKPDHFVDVTSLAGKIRDKKDPVSQFLFDNLQPDTQQALGGDAKKAAKVLAKDLNRLMESMKFYDPERFKGVELSNHSQKFIKEDPKSHTRIRWNRLLLEDTYPKEIKKSLGGVYPDLEIHTPSPEDSQRCFNEYLEDASKRYQQNRLKPGEDFKVHEGRVQVSGQVAVMSINGLLTKVIFDANPDREFYIEESFPLEWMFPNLTPFGIIMKINRNPIPEITQDIVDKDHEFWSLYSRRLIGDWIEYDTPVTNICAWAEKVYLRHDLKDFKGDRKFMRDDNAQKAFSKLRSSIGGTYSWRLGYMGFECPPPYKVTPAKGEEYNRLVKETDFAFKQAFAFCPYSPEAVYRYVQFLSNQGRNDDALAVARTCVKLDPQNDQIRNLVQQIESIRDNIQRMQQGGGAPKTMDVGSALGQIDSMIQAGQTEQAKSLLDQIVANPAIDAQTLLLIARKYLEMNDTLRLEKALQRMVQIVPDNPEAWYDFAGLQAMLQRPEAIQALRKAIELSNARLKQDPKARDLVKEAVKDVRFGALQQNPEFKKLVGQ